MRPGRPISDIGRAIEDHATAHRLGVVRTFVGHGIGEQFHTDLQIPHYYTPQARTVMEAGMVFTIEPMITQGSPREVVWDDGWTAVTEDRKLSAQFEHTVLVTPARRRDPHRRAPLSLDRSAVAAPTAAAAARPSGATGLGRAQPGRTTLGRHVPQDRRRAHQPPRRRHVDLARRGRP